MQTLSTHPTRRSAESVLFKLLGTGFTVIAYETYRTATGRVLTLTQGNEWEIRELTAIEARHAEIVAAFGEAARLEEEAADHEARAVAAPRYAANNLRFAAEKRSKAAAARARGEALTAVAPRSVKPVSKVA